MLYNGGIMLSLSEFSLNHHPFGVKMVKKVSGVEFRG